MKSDTKRIAKRLLRDPLIPIFRAALRYAPWPSVRLWLWKSFAEHMQFADYPFVAKAESGAMFRGNTQDLIQRFIYYFGIWEPNLTYWIKSRLQPGDVFVDVGANIGYYTLLASKLVGAEGKVIAIEASPAIFKRLDENIMRNRTDNVELLNIAIDAKSGERDLFSAPAGNIGATSLIQGHGFRLEAHVKTDTLAAVISPDAVARLRLIKIDVEGAEAAVVAGLKPILQGCPDNMEILIEISPHLLRRQGLVPKDVLNP